MKIVPWLIGSCLLSVAPLAGQASMTGHAATLYQQAIDTGHFYPAAAKLKPDIWPTSDGKGFVVTWKTTLADPQNARRALDPFFE